MTGEPSSLDPDEKVDLWRQRFFEAQAAAEEFVLGEHGDEGLAAWIRANSRITADLLRAQRPAGMSTTDHYVTRLQRQLMLYDSAVTSEPQPSGTVLRNADCGILRYRRRAARAGVVLTFSSPCGYCQQLNTAIAARYLEPEVTVSCEQAGDGCTWRVSAQASADAPAASPQRGRAAD
ncbi:MULTISPECIES: hypothetical protein [Micromonospora]|uniref:Uncharacterized protein n=1 Tax=Micromonospora yangpuensis TaxID=683228 RepID=A0A1C6UKV4_9ACTN|nr:hypothetical protein [Micromonospora yangpuensis]GGM17422.1 hypothetical protein GCM10012279_39450 [Micromonospora yangpuensis]SCL54695.1 hypothetical protein GA0070617_2740 [Micromonospora yangpuensis]